MTKLVPPMTKTIFVLAVAAPFFLSMESVKDMATASAYQWSGLVFKALSASATTAVALLSFHQIDPNKP